MNHLKKISLLAILAIAILIPVTVTQAFAANVSGTGDLLPAVPTFGPNGQTVTLYAQNGEYNPTDLINATILGHTHDISAGSITVNATGGFNGTVTIPSDATVGSNTITTTDQTGNAGSTPFTVNTPAFTTPATPNNGPIHQSVFFAFNHMIASTSATVKFGTTPIGNATVTTNSTGGWAGTVEVPITTPTGSQPVTVNDGTNSINTPFTVTTPVINSVSPNFGPVGQPVSISVNHFATNGTIAVSIGGQSAGTTAMNATGGFTHTFNVPSGATTGVVSVTDGANTATSPFTVSTPLITTPATPNNGPIHQSVFFAFNHMIASTSATVKFGTTPIGNATVTTNSTGGWKGTVEVPITTPTGSQPVTVNDGTNSINTPFTVTTPVINSVSPNFGPVGQPVSISVNHFATNGTIAVSIGGQSAGTTAMNATGGFTHTFNVPSGATTGVVSVTDGANTATSPFTVSTPLITTPATPNNGPIHQSVFFAFNHMIASTSATVKFGTTPIGNATVTTNSTGGWAGTVEVPITTPTGSQPVTVNDGTNSINTPFTVTTPVINSVSPNFGPVGQPVSISVNHFATNGTIAVSIGGQSAGTTAMNATGGFTHTFNVPSGATTGVVSVTDGANTATSPFTVNTPAFTTPATPNNGPIHQSVFFAFNHMIASTSATVNFGSTPITNATVTTNSTGGWAGTVEVPITTPTGSQPVTVNDGTNSINTPFTVTTPVINSVSPNFGPVGQPVSISVNHFATNGTIAVSIGGQSAGTTAMNATGGFTHTFNVPSGATTGVVSVTDGANTATSPFTVSTPLITTPATPNNGPIHQSVFFAFNHMIASTSATVKFGTTPIGNATVTTNSTGGWKGTVEVPITTPTGSQPVTVNDGTNSINTPFTVTTPVINSVSPNFGPVGQPVSISVNHFATNGTIAVSIGGQSAGTTAMNATGGFTHTFNVPSGATTGVVSVTDGANTATSPFTVSTPLITTPATPNNGPIHQSVFFAFNHMIASTSATVKFGTTPIGNATVTTNSTGGWAGTVEVPITTPTGSQPVTVNDGTNSINTPFTVTTPVINSVSPNFGPVGQPVSISVNHFATNGTIAVSIGGQSAGTTAMNATGGFTHTFNVPSGATTGVVSVTDGANTATSPFTVNTPAFTTPATPNNGPIHQSVFFAFNHMIASTSATVNFGSTPITNATVTTNSTGGWAGTVEVPITTPTGSQPVTVNDGTNSINTPFTVTTPVINSVSPNFGPVGQPVSISVNHFATNGTIAVSIGGQSAGTTAMNATGGFTHTFNVPSGATTGVVSVTDGANTATSPFTVSTPLITTPATPNNGPIHQSVFFAFNHMIASTSATVKFGTTPIGNATVTTNSTGGWKGTVEVPITTPTGSQPVTVNDGTNSINTPFTVTTPVINSVSPNFGPVGQPVSISVNHFATNGTIAVSIGGQSAGTTAMNATGGFTHTFNVPSGATTGVVSVTDGANTKTSPFTVNTPAFTTPATPNNGPIHQSVFFAFNHMIASTSATVNFGSTPITNATVTTNSTGGWKGTVEVPITTPTGSQPVTVNDGTNSINTPFTVFTSVINSVSPNNGPVGQPVSISVNHFATNGTIAVSIGGQSAGTTAMNATGGFTHTFNVPSGATTGVVSVTDGANTKTSPFTVTTPTITTPVPNIGSNGTSVTVQGLHYITVTPITLKIGSQTVSPTSNSTGGFSSTFTLASSTFGLVNVNATDGTNTSPNTTFTITTPNLNAASPTSGPVGQPVVIAFNHFVANHAYTIKFGGITGASSTTNSTGGFNGTVNVPASAGNTISVTDTTNTLTTPFTVTSRLLSAAIPDHGPFHQGGTITGTNFVANHTLSFTISVGEGTSLPTTPAIVTTNKTGGFIATFNVPTNANTGVGTISVNDGSAGVTTPFTVTTSAINTVSPNQGPVGQPVLISANNFATNGTISVHLGGILVGTPAMNSTGGFSGTFNVPVGADENEVAVSDGANNVTSTFTVTTPTFSTPATPDKGPTHTPVSFSVNHFIAGSTITLKLNSTTLVTTPATLTANSTGGVDGTFTVPNGFASGTATVNATEGTNFATTPFTVTTPTTSYTPAGGATGTTISASGLHFVPSFPITIKYDSTTVKTLIANSTGGYATTFVVPSSSIGSHNIIASDNATHSVTTPTSVTTAIVVSPTFGPNGTTVTVTGTNLIPTHAITITFNGTTVTTTPATVTSGATGGFTATFKVPGSPSAPATVQATDGVNSPSASFTVTTPVIALNPSSGVAGQSFSITGTNVVPSHAITFKFNGVTIPSTPATVTSNSTGGFTATLKVPASPAEFNNVTANDGTNSPSSTFTVGTSSAIVTVTEGTSVGKTVTVNGTHFIPSHVITFKIGTTPLVTNPATVTTLGNGSFSGVTFTVPTGTTLGLKTITATDGTTSPQVSISIIAGINISPLSGPNGTQVTMTGTNFIPSHAIAIHVNEGSVLNVTSNSLGGFTGQFKIQGITSPTTLVDASDGDSDPVLTFTMQTPSVSITPSTGAAGQTVTISGNHLVASHAVTFKVGATTVTTIPTTVTTLGNGSFSHVTFKIPGTAVSGANTVTANDGTNSPFDTFTIGTVPTITLTPSTGNVGQTISVAGLHLAPTTKITLKFGTTVLVTTPATITTDSSGAFTATFKVPAALASTVTVAGSDGTNSPTDLLSVSPFITLSPASGGNGTQVTVTGTSFGASQPILLLYNGVPLTTSPASITSTSTGSFPPNVKFTVTNFPVGGNTITAVDTSHTASTNFTAISTAISLNPSTGVKGQTVKVTGINFIPLHAVTLKFNSTTLVTTPAAVTSLANGTFFASFTVPSTATPNNFVNATDGTNMATTPFTLGTTSSLLLNSTDNSVGKTVKVNGTNFIPLHAITIKFNGTAVTTTPATVTSNSLGVFGPVTFKVPPSVKPGLAPVSATDGANSPSTAFSVIAGLTLSPTSGPNGTQVSFSGTSFGAIKPFNFTYAGVPVTTTPTPIKSIAAGTLTGKFTIRTPVEGSSFTANDTAATSATFTVTTSSISLNPSSGVKGQTVKVTGTNFIPLHAITLKFNSTSLTTTLVTTPAAVTSLANGTFFASFTVPSTATPNNFVNATDGTNKPSASFTIGVIPAISLNSTSNVVGKTIAVNGSNFVPLKTIIVKFNGTAVTTTPATVTSNSLGVFGPVTFKVPPTVKSGLAPVNATDGTNKPATAFSVIAGLTLSPTSGPNGTQVSFSGTSFGAIKPFNFTYAGVPVTTTPTPIKSIAAGTLTGKFTIRTPVEGSSFTANDTAATSATFTVTTSSISLNPSSGVKGQTVKVTGTNFIPLHAITLKFNSTSLTTTLVTTPAAVTSLANGTFFASFTVPSTATPNNFVNATDGTNKPSASFTIGVIPAISLNSTSNVVGKTIAVNGSNFVPLKTIIVKFNGTAVTTTPATVTSNSLGVFGPVTFKVPPTVKSGSAPVSATDSANSPSTPFSVVSAITLSPTSGPNGTQVSFSGTSFGAIKPFNFTYAGVPVTTTPTPIKSIAAGTLTGKFTIRTPVEGSSFTANDTAATSATFTVTTSSISLNATTGIKGQTVKVTGTNFIPLHAITLKFNSTSLTTTLVTTPAAVTSLANGTFFATFKVPSTATPNNFVNATDGTNKPSASFTIGTTPTVSLLTNTGFAGTSVSISGSNLLPFTKVTIKYDTNTLTTTPATVTTDSSGKFSAIAQVPATTTSGSHPITVTDGFNNPGTAFSVVSAITLSPTTGPPGTSVTFTGTGFQANMPFNFTFSGPIATVPTPIKSSATGGFTGKFTAPNEGSTFTANDTAHTSAPFTFTTSSISLNPSFGVKGQTVKVTGTHFVPSKTITLKLNSTTLTTTPAAVTSLANGTFFASFTVPSTATPNNSISATDGTNQPTTPFTIGVIPAISLNSTSNVIGKTIAVNGSHFAPSKTITIKFNGTAVTTTPATVTSNSLGVFGPVTFKVPPTVKSGLAPVSATDSANSPSTAFSVIAGLTLSPTSGPNGTQVSFSGTSFGAIKPFNFTYAGVPVTTTPTPIKSIAAGTLTGKFTIRTPVEGSSFTANDTAATSATFTVTTSSISLNPSSGVKGQTVKVTGTNFIPLHAITLKFNSTSLTTTLVTTPAAVTSLANGTFFASFTVPSTATPNNFVNATDGTNKPSASFTIGVIPAISLNSTSNVVGKTIAVNGSNFVPLKTIIVKFNGTAVTTTPATVTSNSLGVFGPVTFKVPPTVKSGLAPVNATDGTNKPATAFSVIAGLTLSPTSGPNGTQVSFSGTSFGAIKPFNFTYAGVPVTTTPTPIKSIAAGTLTGKFTIRTPVEGSSFTANDTAATSATFTVTTSSISLNPSSGVKGQTVKVTGTNFIPLHAITLKFNSTSLTTTLVTTPAAVTSLANGTFFASFTVPSTATPNNFVNATDGTNKPSASFTIGVIPAISLNSTSNVVGKTIAVNGSNFVPLKTIIVKFNGTAVTTTPATVTSNSLGVFGPVTFKVPPTVKSGLAPVNATDGTNKPATAFSVIAGLTLSPTSGPNGTQVSFSGTSFGAIKPFNFTYAGVPVTTTPTPIKSIAAGTLTGKFTIRTPVEGSSFTANDTAATSATFTVTTSSISLNPSSGVKGQTVKVTGTNFIPLHAITLKFNSTSLTTTLVTTPAAVTSLANGTFFASFTVPSTATPNNFVNATDGTNKPSASFTIGVIPAISLNSTNNIAGSTIKVNGSNFIPLHAITIKFNGTAVTTTPATVTSNSLGVFGPVTFKVPSTVKSAGPAPVNATDGTNKPATASNVIAFIKLVPTSGPNGTSVSVTGTSFKVTHTITLKFNDTTVTTTPPTITSTSSGAFTATFTVPGSPSAAGTVNATDGTNHPAASFTVTSPIVTLSKNIASSSSFVTFTGSNFIPSHAITIKFDGTTPVLNPITITSTSSGAFSGLFQVPPSAIEGNHTVTMTDGSSTVSKLLVVSSTALIVIDGGDSGSNRVLEFAISDTNYTNAISVLGQPDFVSSSRDTTASSLSTPSAGVVLDSSGNLWVADSNNDRVLKYNKPFTTGESASFVIGQTDFVSSNSANPPTASSLYSPKGLAFDSSGNLWVADSNNERILKFQASSLTGSNGPSASFVIGRPDFVSSGSAVTQNNLYFPQGIAFDSSGNLWVNDQVRVLKFTSASLTGSNGPSASFVIGQPDFVSSVSAVTQKTFSQGGNGIAFDSSGNLWVSDVRGARVLKFASADLVGPNQPNATLVVGQADFTSSIGTASQNGLRAPATLAFDSSGNLWVGDVGNHRVLEYLQSALVANHPNAHLVIGQPDFTTHNGATSQKGMSGPNAVVLVHY